MTIREACELWVSRDMNAIPQSVLVKLQQLDPDDIEEITPITKADRVYVCSAGEMGEVIAIDEDAEEYTVQLDNGETITTEGFDLEREDYDRFPMWGSMWSFSCSFDEDWALSHLEEMAACGFRLYESEDYGLVFDIDAAGFDFYEAFWVPLYKARGLHWHDEAEEKEAEMRRKGYRRVSWDRRQAWLDKDDNFVDWA